MSRGFKDFIRVRNRVSAPADYGDTHRGAHAATYAHVYGSKLPGLYWRAIELPATVRLISGAGVRSGTHLDIAAGTCRLADVSRALDGNFRYFATDVSDDMLRQGEARHGGRAIVADGRSLPVADSTISLITLFRFLLNAPEDVGRDVLRECRRVLSNDGLLVANVHALPWSLLGIKRRLFRLLGLERGGVMSAARFVGLFDDFEVVGSVSLAVVPVSGRLPSGIVGSWICKADRALRSIPWIESTLSGELIVVARPRRGPRQSSSYTRVSV